MAVALDVFDGDCLHPLCNGNTPLCSTILEKLVYVDCVFDGTSDA